MRVCMMGAVGKDYFGRDACGLHGQLAPIDASLIQSDQVADIDPSESFERQHP